MTRKYLVYVLIALAAALAGCVFWPGAAPIEKQIENSFAPLISLPSAVPSMPESSPARTPEVSPFDLSGARWMEYKLITSDGGTADVRLEYSTGQVNGGRMVSIKRTQTTNDVSSFNSNDGGKSISMRSSSSQSSTTSNMVPFEQIRADDPILYADELTASPAGSDSIMVPKGTYDCKKYLASFKGSDATYWGAPGVPVPVKIYTACDGTTLELVNWG